jgi:hypothetical protein
MSGPYQTPPVGRVGVPDFGPGQPNEVRVFHGGAMVVIAATGDPAFLVPTLLRPQAGTVDVVVHGVPGRFSTRMDGEIDIPPDVVADLLVRAGVPRGTPLRCLTCWAGENPLAGLSAGQRLATAWGGPVSAPDGLLQVTGGSLSIHVGDWDPDPVFGGQQFHVRQTPSGHGRGRLVPFAP